MKALVRFLAVAVKLWLVETEPAVAENADKNGVEALTKGDVSGETVPVTVKVLLVAPLLETVTFPDKLPSPVAAATRIETAVLETVPEVGVMVRGAMV